MLDPLTAISLAGNITQFTGFAIDVVGVIYKLHGKDDGGLSSNLAYERYARSFAENVARIQRAITPPGGVANPAGQTSKLEIMANDCTRTAAELVKLLEDLKTKEQSGMWDTFSKALRSVWNEEKIKEMLGRLKLIKESAESEMLLNISEKIDTLLERQASLSTRLDDSTNEAFRILKDNRQLTEDVLVGNTFAAAQLHRFVENAVKSNVDQAKDEIIGAVRMLEWARTSENWSRAKTYNAALPRLGRSIQADMDKKLQFRYRVRSHLQFPSLSERFEEILPAYKETFQWVFERPDPSTPWDSFSDWLQASSGIYWIRGKPGSGKSCLMKYLHDTPETGKLLRVWSQGLPLVVAGFFFWYSGTDLQTSLNGLLRSILLQILDQQPTLLPLAFPKQWDDEKIDMGLNDTSLGLITGNPELMKALVRIASQTVFPVRICLFIDGLDEYRSSHEEVVDLVKTIASSPSIKLCISSRPWPVFVKAFGSCPGLMLQDLTRGDIQTYVTKRLGESHDMKKLQDSEPEEGPLLIEEIVEKSVGVFLWVRLVVTSLLTGLTNSDHIADLQERLRQLPGELQDLYIYMLKRIDPFYLQQALQLLYIVHHSRRPLTLLAMSIADEMDVEGVVKGSPARFTEVEVASRCEALEGKILSRCLGLLECHTISILPDQTYINDDSCSENLNIRCRYNTPTRRVQFMHRTVKDFFDKMDINEEFQKSLGGQPFTYNVHSALALAQLGQLKRLFAVPLFGAWASAYPTFWHLVKECFHHAAQSERLDHKSLSVIMDSLDSTAQHHYRSSMPKNAVWSPTWIHTHSSFQTSPHHGQRVMFIALGIRLAELEHYTRDQVEGQGLRHNPLQQSDLDFLLRVVSQAKDPNRRICNVILAAGADTNAGDPSTWEQLLADSRSRLKRGIPSQTVYENDNAILEQFVSHGADLGATLSKKNEKNEKITVSAPIILLQRGDPRLVFIMLDISSEPLQHVLWQEALRYVYQDLRPTLETDSHNRTCLKKWVEIYKLILEYGASPSEGATVSVRLGPKTRSRVISATTVVREVFSRWEPEAAQTLLALLQKDLGSNLGKNAQKRSSFTKFLAKFKT